MEPTKTEGIIPGWRVGFCPQTRKTVGIWDCFKTFWGVGTWTRGFDGVAVSECCTNFFERLGQKNPRRLFYFFEFRPRGWAMPPRKMVKCLTFLKNSRKIEGAKYTGAPCTRSISVVDPTPLWGRFSPPSPKFLGEPKQIFRNFGHFVAPYRKNPSMYLCGTFMICIYMGGK